MNDVNGYLRNDHLGQMVDSLASHRLVMYIVYLSDRSSYRVQLEMPCGAWAARTYIRLLPSISSHTLTSITLAPTVGTHT
jgi:hypothetical protein